MRELRGFGALFCAGTCVGGEWYAYAKFDYLLLLPCGERGLGRGLDSIRGAKFHTKLHVCKSSVLGFFFFFF